LFTGIIEALSSSQKIKMNESSIQLQLARPGFFEDLKIGDSVAVNGTCLTVEALTSDTFQVTIGFETLQILGLSPLAAERFFSKAQLNLERPMLIGDRVHGHWVTGHVDAVGTVERGEEVHDGWLLTVKFPEALKAYFWKKGSVCLNGVSLTINDVAGSVLSVFLIPETLRKTNLKLIEPGQTINIEADYLAKAIVQAVSAGALKNALNL
jgi:riboflavin synthase